MQEGLPASRAIDPGLYASLVEGLIERPLFADWPREDRLLSGRHDEIEPNALTIRAPAYEAGVNILAEAYKQEHPDAGELETIPSSPAFEAWAQGLKTRQIAEIRTHYRPLLWPIVARIQACASLEHSKITPEAFAAKYGFAGTGLRPPKRERVARGQPTETQPTDTPIPVPAERGGRPLVIVSEPEMVMNGLREHQHPYMRDIFQFMRGGARPVEVTEGGEVRTYNIHGTVVEAPTGSGKTALIARTMTAAGIGQMREDGSRPRALLVVPSLDDIDQLTGKIGDDTLRRFAPSMKVGGFSGKEKDRDADVIVATIEQFICHIQPGSFADIPIDLLAIDEGHHLLEPRFMQEFLHNWEERPVIAFTATSAYSIYRDLRKLLPEVINHGDLVSYTIEGILNSAQLFLAVIDPVYSDVVLHGLEENDTPTPEQLAAVHRAEHKATVEATINFVRPLLEQGRRGIIYCRPGGQAYYARDLAARLRTMTLTNGRTVQAKAAHSFTIKNDPDAAAMKEYAMANSRLDILTTVDKAKESYNAEVDFVLITYGVESPLKMFQIVGRGTRPSEKFPVTIYAQFISSERRSSRTPVTLYDTFGLDTVEPGVIIGRDAAPIVVGETKPGGASPKSALPLEAFPTTLQTQFRALSGRLIGEALVGSNAAEIIPPDYIPLETVYKPAAAIITLPSAIHRLKVAGYDCKIVVKSMPDGYIAERYYEPSARDFFTDNPIPPRATPAHANYRMLEERLDVSRTFLAGLVEDIAAEDGVDMAQELRLDSRGRVSSFFKDYQIKAIENRFLSIPVITETDTTIEAVATETGMSYSAVQRCMGMLQPRIESSLRRVPNAAKGKKLGRFISDAQASTIKAELCRYPLASAAEWTLTRMSEATGIPEDILKGRVRPQHRRTGFYRRVPTSAGIRTLWCYDDENAHKIMTHAAGRQLPAHYGQSAS